MRVNEGMVAMSMPYTFRAVVHSAVTSSAVLPGLQGVGWGSL